MTKVVSSPTSTSNEIFGHGLRVSTETTLRPGIILSPSVPDIALDDLAKGCEDFADYSTCVLMKEIITFTLRVEEAEPGKALTVKTWNSLWVFSLLSLACSTPCMSLFTKNDAKFAVSNRNRFIRPLADIADATQAQLDWAITYFDHFDSLVADESFSRAVRYLTNSHYLFDIDARIMLLWAGIECLLGVESELRNRIALHAAIMLDAEPAEKHAYLKTVRSAYDVRSKVVHGRAKSAADLQAGYEQAASVLTRLLRKCVELGRVPSAGELDAAASKAALI